MMSRRELLAYTAAAGAGGLFLGACSSSSTKPAGSSTTSGSSGSGSLPVGMRATLTSLTPLGTQPYQWSQMMGFALYDPLVKIESNGTLSPVLAESWDISSPTETIINIRPGVKFQNGAPVTAADVAYSIAARSDPKLIAQTSGRAVMTPAQWHSAEVLGTNRVRINTTERVRILTQPQPILVIPNNAFTKYNLNTQAVGSGPYTLTQFVSGTSLSVTANPHYWGGAPSLKQLTFRFFSDVSEEALNLRSGEINAVYDVEPLNLKQVSGVPGTKVVHEATYADWWIIQMGNPPLDNPAVRRALRYCFNMDLINTSAFGGLGTNPWNPFSFYPPQYRSNLALDVSYNPDKAKSLLKAAGASNITVPIVGINTYQDSINEGQIIEQGLRAAGVNATFEALTLNAWLDATYGKGTWNGIAFNAGNIPVPFLNMWDYLVDPAVLLSSYTKGSPNPSAEALYNQVESGTDAQEPGLLQKAQQMLIDDAVAYFMFGAPVSMILPENLNGVETNGYGDVRWNHASF